MALIPVLTSAKLAALGRPVMTDLGMRELGVWHVWCKRHELFFSAPQGCCLKCYEESPVVRAEEPEIDFGLRDRKP